MKKKLNKTIKGVCRIRILSVIVLCVMLCACAGRENNHSETTIGKIEDGTVENSEAELAETYLFKMSDMEVPYKTPMALSVGAGNIYLYGESRKVSGESGASQESAIISYTADGAMLGKVYSHQGNVDMNTGAVSGDRIMEMTTDEDGNLLVLIGRTGVASNFRLVKYDREGKIVWSSQLKNISAMEYALKCDKENIYLIGDNQLLICDQTGEVKDRVSGEKGWILQDVYTVSDGCVYVKCVQEGFAMMPTAWQMAELDVESGQWKDYMDAFWKSTFEHMIQGDEHYDFYLWDKMRVVGWNVGSDAVEEVVSFLELGVDGEFICDLQKGTGEEFLVLLQDDAGKASVGRFVKETDETLSNRQVITLGCFGASGVAKEVLKFNQTNEQYVIRVVDYSIYGEEKENWITRLNLDIAAERMPDILSLGVNREMPEEAYIRQGLFEDLYAWIDEDPELERSDFLTNILEAYATGEKLYQLPTLFYTSAYAMKTSIIGERDGWSLEDVLSVAEKYPESSLFEGHIKRDDILYDLFQYGLFMDEVTNTCSFDSELFIQLLEWMQTIPATTDSKVKFPMQREDKILISCTGMNSFRQFQWLEERTFGEDVTLLGFPGDETGCGLIINGGVRLAMSAQSGCKEGAWQFIRGFFSEEYQQAVCTTSAAKFPVRVDVLEWLGEQELTSTPNEGENGYYLYGEYKEVPPMTEEDVAKAIAYLKKVNRVEAMNYEVYGIVTEEVEPFFAGQKSAKEVAKIIQSRVSIYLAEQQ